jgi:hypothetical protein
MTLHLKRMRAMVAGLASGGVGRFHGWAMSSPRAPQEKADTGLTARSLRDLSEAAGFVTGQRLVVDGGRGLG